MIDYVIFLAKVFLGVIPLFLILGIPILVLFGIGMLINTKSAKATMSYFFFIGPIFLYLLGFAGAYFYEVYNCYSDLFNKEWAVYVICLIGSVFVFRIIYAEWRRNNSHFRSIHPLGYTSLRGYDKFSEENFNLIAAMTFTKYAWAVPVSFIFFSFFSEYISTLYTGIPHYIANLWVE